MPKDDLLPISKSVVSRFVIWASVKEEEWSREDESVRSNTIRSYLAGIKAWHYFHNYEYPHDTTPRVNLLLRATERLEAKVKDRQAKRPPVLIHNLKVLLDHKSSSEGIGQAAFAAALCTFWGTTRLGELVSDGPHKQVPTWNDLIWASGKVYAKITLFEAKTARPGELQFIHLQRQSSQLDPIPPLEALYMSTKPKPTHPIFSYRLNKDLIPLSKKAMMAWCESIWSTEKSKRTGKNPTGNSFRIGGASL